MFPNLKGKVDMDTILISKDLKFRSWCEELLEEYWIQGGRFDYNKTTVI